MPSTGSEMYTGKERRGFGQFVRPAWVQTFILLIVCFFLFVTGAGRWDLWNPDEPRYAQVAKEMVGTGDWILMHVNGNTYVDKPPLFFWLIALSSFLWQGFTSFSARFPSAFFSTLTVLLTFILGRKLYGSRTGLLSALILATSFEFAYLSTRANIDATLTFFTTASIFFFLRGYEPGREEGREEKDEKSLSIYGFYTGMAFATLVKGPVGFILPLLIGLGTLLAFKDWKAMKRMKLLTGMILFVVIVLSWYLPAVLKGGQDFLNQTLFHQTIERFAKGTSHIRPPYYYLSNFPVDFLPWFLFLPGAFVYGLSRKGGGLPRNFLFLVVWFAAIFLFFSFSRGKRALYLLPLYPAASLMVGRLWDDYLAASGRFSVREMWITLPVYLLIIVCLLTGMLLYALPAIASFTGGHSTPKVTKMVIGGAGLGAKYLSFIPPSGIVPFILLLVGSGILLFLAQRLRYRFLVFVLIAATAGIGFFYATRVVFPLINPYKSARYISQEIVQRMSPGDRLILYGYVGSAVTAQYNFYTGIVPILETESEAEILDLFRSKEKVFCLVEYDDYEALTGKYPDLSLNLILRRGVGSRDMAVVSNR